MIHLWQQTYQMNKLCRSREKGAGKCTLIELQGVPTAKNRKKKQKQKILFSFFDFEFFLEERKSRNKGYAL